jgi:16S rRNA (uracil1498-N3)-methyltransferase
LITILVAPRELDGSAVVIDGSTYHHVFRVRRATSRDRLRLVDGEGRARWARVERRDQKSAELRLGEAADGGEPKATVKLLSPAPRGQRAAYLVEKGTELGVAAFRFFHCERNRRRLGEGGRQRLERVASAAVEQSHRSRLPEISVDHEWEELERMLSSEERCCFLDPETEKGLEDLYAAGDVSVVVGPEGGWTGVERERLLSTGARALRLPTPILRVETAAVAAATLFLARL